MLTKQEKSAVRLYLGHPDNFRFKNTRLESVLENLSEEAEAQIRVCLTNLKTVEEAILTGPGSPITSAGVKRVDEIWFFEGAGGINGGFKSLKAAGSYFVNRISIICGVPIENNAFGSGGYGGDFFMPGNGSGTGTIPLG